MAVESKIDDKENIGVGFPKLMKNNVTVKNKGFVVLFEGKFKGVVVYAEKDSLYRVGEMSNNWLPKNFKDFNGTIELKNS